MDIGMLVGTSQSRETALENHVLEYAWWTQHLAKSLLNSKCGCPQAMRHSSTMSTLDVLTESPVLKMLLLFFLPTLIFLALLSLSDK